MHQNRRRVQWWRILGLAMMVSVMTASGAQAFTEPGGTPLTTSSPAIINTGSANQVKSGDLTVGNMKADKAITFGSEKRSSWLPTGAACAWEGWRCDCRSDGSSAAAISLTFGVRCAGGRVEDARMFGLAISSKSKSCGASAPSPCAQSLYTRENTDSGTFLEVVSDEVSGVASEVASNVVGTVKFVGSVIATTTKMGMDITKAVVGGGIDAVVDTAKAAGGFVGDVWDAGKDMTREISRLAVDPGTNPIELVVGTGVAAVKAATTIVVAAAKTVVTVAKTVVTGAVKVVTNVAKALCFWC